jgi:hypothetical protein
MKSQITKYKLQTMRLSKKRAGAVPQIQNYKQWPLSWKNSSFGGVNANKTQENTLSLMKSFCGGPGCTYSAVLRNAHGDDTSFEASYAVLALQMLPHAVGFFQKEPPLAAGGKS